MTEKKTEYEVRTIKMAIMTKGQPLYSEMTTLVEIMDEASGEFVKVTQQGGHTDYEKSITIDVDEWPLIKKTIEVMMKQCRTGDVK